MLLRKNLPPHVVKAAVCLALLIATFIIAGSLTGSSSPATHGASAATLASSVDEVPQSTIAKYQLQAQNMARHTQVVIFEDAQFIAAVKTHQVEVYLAAVQQLAVDRYLEAVHAAQMVAVAAYLTAVHQAEVQDAAAAAANPTPSTTASSAQTDAISNSPAAQPSPPSTGNPPGDTVTDFQRAAWDKVNVCEEGGNWHVDGATYSGGLGFTHTNWTQFNTFGFPADAADATPDQQIQVATAFAEYYWHSPDAAPDQDGCGGGY
jgi:hypothetical protein